MSIKKEPDENKRLVINGNKIEKAAKFKYLDSAINLGFNCDEEIRILCGLANKIF